MSDTAEIHKQTEVQMEEIERKVKEQPLTSDLLPLAHLQKEYEPGSNFMAGVGFLEKTYKQIRMVRGDGNCYYRAFLYSLVEAILADLSQTAGFVQYVKEDSWKSVLKAGYDEMMLEAFYDTMVELFERLAEGKLDASSLHSEMNQENSTSDYCTWYCRVVVAAHLKADPDRFLPFMDGLDVDTFCKTQVEPMGKECEQVQVLALAEAFGVQVAIEYLDGHDTTVTRHVFGPENAKTKLSFLYRPGHYDILYAK